MLVIVWGVAIVLLTLAWLALRTPWGRVLRAVRDDEDAAASLGKNVFAYKLQALALGAALAGVAGLFYAWEFSFFSPDDFQPLLTFFAWMILLLGGLGRVWAVPVGALVFGFIFAGTRFLEFPPFSWFASDERAYLRLIIIGMIILVLVVAPPAGPARATGGRWCSNDGAARRRGRRPHVRRLRAVDGATFSVEAHSITGLIGPNGAGKSTLFATIAGSLKPDLRPHCVLRQAH